MSGDRFARYLADPVAFAEEVLGVNLYSRQREIIEAVRDHERTAVKSGNAVGKSLVAAVAILSWLAGGPGSVVVFTSATEAQLRRVLGREVRRRFKDAQGFFRGAVVTETEIRLREDWWAAGFSTDRPEAMQGVHAARLLVVLDEASGVSEDIWDAVESLLAGGDAHVLAIGNPLRTSGSFYDCFNNRAEEWRRITVSAYDTPNLTGEDVPRALHKNLVSRKWVERLERRGRDSNEYLVRVLGEFPSAQDDAVVSRVALEQAQAQTLEPGLPLVFGFDPARFGNDESVLALRQGHFVRIIDAWSGLDTMQSTGRVIGHVRRAQEATGRRVRIVVDEPGLGGGVIDRLREQRFEVVAFNGAGRARQPKVAPNRRSELWLDAAEILPLLDLDPADGELARELLAPTFSFDSSGAKVVERKGDTRKRLRRSPDRADAMLLTLAVDPPRVPGRARPGAMIVIPKGRIGDRRVRRGTPTTVARTSVHDPAAAMRVHDPLAEALGAQGVAVAHDVDPDANLYDLRGLR